MQTKEQKQLFLDMQEHPENYTDEQLEAMMDDHDRTPDVQQAWKEFHSSLFIHHSSFRKVAAVFIGILLVSGIAIAAIHFWKPSQQSAEEQVAEANSQLSTLNFQVSSPVRFDDVRLDSILTVVSAHYGKAVSFRNEEARAMQFIMTWKPDAPLSDFIEGLNMFDGLHLSLQGDTIVVDTITDKVSK